MLSRDSINVHEEPAVAESPGPGAVWDPAEFAAFYRRHERAVAAFFMRRTGRAELAADLTSEVFAAILVEWRHNGPRRETERGWLFGIAQHKLVDSYRRGAVEDRARRQLGMRPTVVTDESLARIEALTAETPALELVQALSADERAAVTARVIDDRPYGEIAAELQLSEQVVRKRVSRALARLRAALGGER
jgi:RNA polymerase sigma-70 factor (ECF subfamily)